MHRKPILFFLNLYSLDPFYTLQLSSLDIFTPQMLDSYYHVKLYLEKHLFMVVINISSLGSMKQASVCCVEIQKLKLKGTDFLFVAPIHKVQV